ncbi:hypothetical protein [uncultured Draconibacterium sp.]|uniref:hypothetical protein n=1 Tax=uncultured Draconibacterium sp. TaxID=1573823 RepID=UPI00321646B3
MKYLIIVLMFFAISCSVFKDLPPNNHMSEIPKYLSLEELEGDTVTYMVQSLYERKNYYIGKKVKVFLKYLDMEIVNQLPGYHPGNKLIAPYVSLYFCEMGKLYTEESGNNIPLFVSIDFESPALLEPITELSKKNNNKWTKEEYEFYKDLIIKDIGIPEYGVFRKYFGQQE